MTTTSKLTDFPPETVQLLKNTDLTAGSTTHTCSIHTLERRSSNTYSQQTNTDESNSSSSSSATNSKQAVSKGPGKI